MADILKPALRRAGITQLPGITPSVDQYGELIPEANRMLALWNCDGHKIYTTSIDRYAMDPQQTSYFIGPTGDGHGNTGFVAPRPLFIYRANVVLVNTFPEVRIHLHLLSDEDWAAKSITEIAMPWPYQLYNDGAFPDSKLYLFGYPTENNDLELFTWQELKNDFTAVTDAVSFPPGYEDALVTNLALRACALYPYDSKLSGMQMDRLVKDAARALEQVKILNMRCIPHVSEAANINSAGRGYTDALNRKIGGIW